MLHKQAFRVIGLLCLLTLLFSLSIVTAQDGLVIDLRWNTLFAMGLPEQFVFVMNDAGTVSRVTPDAPISMLEQPIYTMASAEDFVFDPFQLSDNPLGPFEAGDSLDMTLRDYLGARGSGTYIVDGDMATVDLSFDRLMPNGVYTLWCSTLNRPPEFEVIDKPCGADDGSENTFTSDEYGELQIQMSFPALDLPTETSLSIIAIAWHSDGQTYGEYTGDFGRASFVPLRALLIPPQ
jgi:hypothetical protein